MVHSFAEEAAALVKETCQSFVQDRGSCGKDLQKTGLFRVTRKELSQRLWSCDKTALGRATSSRLVIARMEPNLSTKSWQEVGGIKSPTIVAEMPMVTKSPHTYTSQSTALYHIWRLNGPTKYICMAFYAVGGWRNLGCSRFVKGFLPQVRKLKPFPPKPSPEKAPTQPQPSILTSEASAISCNAESEGT